VIFLEGQRSRRPRVRRPSQERLAGIRGYHSYSIPLNSDHILAGTFSFIQTNIGGARCRNRRELMQWIVDIVGIVETNRP
jgi:hypothetical protein